MSLPYFITALFLFYFLDFSLKPLSARMLNNYGPYGYWVSPDFEFSNGLIYFNISYFWHLLFFFQYFKLLKHSIPSDSRYMGPVGLLSPAIKAGRPSLWKVCQILVRQPGGFWTTKFLTKFKHKNKKVYLQLACSVWHGSLYEETHSNLQVTVEFRHDKSGASFRTTT